MAGSASRMACLTSSRVPTSRSMSAWLSRTILLASAGRVARWARAASRWAVTSAGLNVAGSRDRDRGLWLGGMQSGDRVRHPLGRESTQQPAIQEAEQLRFGQVHVAGVLDAVGQGVLVGVPA